jgi:succinyl-CoA synthetase beta subunit
MGKWQRRRLLSSPAFGAAPRLPAPLSRASSTLSRETSEMKVHEYQAKALFAQFGISIPKGGVAATPDEAETIAAEIGKEVAVKAQVYAGGRGKAGGIKIAATPAEVKAIAGAMLGTRLVTPQTSSQGVPVSRILVEETIDIKRELYLSLVIDSSAKLPVMMASEAGGMDIEEVARVNPEDILRVNVDPPDRFRAFQGRKLAYDLNLSAGETRQAMETMSNLYRLFLAKDCSLAEINPLVATSDEQLIAVDAKLNFDDNADYRQQEIAGMYDWEQEDPVEAQAGQLGIKNFVKLDGNIGCLVNGAGMTMSVVDLLAHYGGRAANFYDIGPAPQSEHIVNAFKLIMADTDVKVLLIDIFAGMGKGDAYARGIVDGYRATNARLPAVVRMFGTNADLGKAILAESGIETYLATDFLDEGRKAVEIAQRAGGS